MSTLYLLNAELTQSATYINNYSEMDMKIAGKHVNKMDESELYVIFVLPNNGWLVIVETLMRQRVLNEL